MTHDPPVPAPFERLFSNLSEVRFSGRSVFNGCFGCGPEHEIGLRVRTFGAEGEVLSPIIVPGRFEGPPGAAHGGIVAAYLDEVLAGAAVHATGRISISKARSRISRHATSSPAPRAASFHCLSRTSGRPGLPVVSARGHPIFAALYDHLIGVAERNFLRPHRAWLAGELRGRVLDVGSGTGLSFVHYSAEADVVGVEPDPHMLTRARPRAEALGRRIALLEACAEALPFPDASFDAAVSALVLCTVQNL